MTADPAPLPAVAVTPGGHRVLDGADVTTLADLDALDRLDPELVAALVITSEELAAASRHTRRLRKAGVTVVEVDPVRRSPLRRSDLQVGTSPGVADMLLLPTFDPLVTNPVGWRREPAVALGVALHRPVDGPLSRWPSETDDVIVLAGPELSGPARRAAVGEQQRAVSWDDDAALADRLRRVGVLVTDPAWEQEPTPVLRTIIHALAVGTPVVTTAAAPAAQLGLPVVTVDGPDELWSTAGDLAADHDRREQVSVAGRRRVLRDHAGPARLGRLLEAVGRPFPRAPRISVTFATNRGAFLEHGIRSIIGQSVEDLEVILLLHGPEVPDPPAGLLEGSGRTFQVHRLPVEYHLGELLNHGIDHATGTYVAKMDDDDWYGRDHLLDLALAIEYSGADLVGKRIDHIYLSPLERTVTRRRAAPERDRPHVSGPTLFGRRDTMARVRFGKLTGPEDSDFQRRLLEDGGRVYGTHSLDVVLNRHGGNTWDTDSQALLDEAERDVAGLDLVATASEPGAYITD
ncbi:glycosyltransferase [Nitriliruptor alkaliphilus]|uniref:glycosyltransferase n=1 Tax=Nitriliruptor alkaliphilus TaxID=427918 RepID=UPI0006978617|nr:glycosyltransferase [Nitriliruptor alkaliphilus]